MMKKRTSKQLAGFTLVEIIVVLGIIAIIIGLGLVNFQASTDSSTGFSASRDLLISDLRVAADKALSQERFQGGEPIGWGVNFVGGYNTYTMFADMDGDRVFDAGETFKKVKLNQDLKLFPDYGGVTTGSVLFNTGTGKTYFNNTELAISATSQLLINLRNKNNAFVDALNITPVGTVSIANPAIKNQAQPNSITGLIGWWKADAITLNNGTLVDQWSDLSTSGRHATQADTTKRPIFVTNVVNSLPVVRFDGENDYLQLLQVPSVKDVTTLRTIIVVMKWGATMNNYCPIVGDTESGYGARFHGDVDSTNKIISSAYAWSQILGGTAYNNGTSTTPASMLKDRANFQIAVFTTTINMRFNTISADRPATFSRFTEGDYAEIIVYDTVLSKSDRQAVEVYLSYKYNIPLSY